MRNVRLERLLISLLFIGIIAFAVAPVAGAQELPAKAMQIHGEADSGSVVLSALSSSSPAVGSTYLLPSGHSTACRGSLLIDRVVAGCLQRSSVAAATATPVARATFDTDMLLRQGVAAAGGGLAGALLLVLPVALAERGGEDVPSDVTAVMATLGYMGGSVVGVQLYSQRRGQSGSWWGTLGGAVLGAFGGPFFLLTVPSGAVLGFTLMPTSLLP